jgi:phosphate transport system protein
MTAPTAPHTMKKYEEELDQLKQQVLQMGGLVERAIDQAIRCTVEQDSDLAQTTIEGDAAINAMEVQSDELMKAMLVRRQPAASDLRLIVASIKVVTDLERMGDLAAGIAEGMLRSLEHPPKNLSSFALMGEKVKRQVRKALDAFSRGDIELAMEVIENDEHIDLLHKSMYRETLTYMMEDPRQISSSIVLSNMAKNLERIADHATNIGEMVVYMIRGHDIRHVDHAAAARMIREESRGH